MKNKKTVLAVIALVAVIAIFAGVYFATRPEAAQGAKAFSVTVVHADGSTKEFDYRTDAEKLGTFSPKSRSPSRGTPRFSGTPSSEPFLPS